MIFTRSPASCPSPTLSRRTPGKPQVRFTAHQHCGAATYVFVQEDGIVPVNRMVNVESFFETIEQMAENLKKGGTINKYKALLEGVKNMHDSVKEGEQAATTEFWKIIGKTLIGQNFEALREFHWNALFIGTMHFMDRYNYDLDRVKPLLHPLCHTGRKTDPVLHLQQRAGVPGAGLEEVCKGTGEIGSPVFSSFLSDSVF